MATNGQAYASWGTGTVTFNWYYSAWTAWTWTSPVYIDASSGGTTPWNLGYAGGIVPVTVYDGAYPYSILGYQIGISDSTGKVYGSANLGSNYTPRAGTLNELAILNPGTGYVPMVCIGGSSWWSLSH